MMESKDLVKPRITMFASLSGTVISINEKNITLASGPIGFDINVPDESNFTLNAQSEVFIYFHWNQDQGPTLFGFKTQSEKEIFKQIISCSGVGPRLGLAILYTLTPGQFIQAVSTNDQKLLSSISGIGAKKAEQIIVHLKSKIAKLVESGIDLGDHSAAKNLKELSDVLTSLSYNRSEINDTLAYLRTHKSVQLPFDQLLKDALSFLTKLR